jgi:hypothetical protein
LLGEKRQKDIFFLLALFSGDNDSFFRTTKEKKKKKDFNFLSFFTPLRNKENALQLAC